MSGYRREDTLQTVFTTEYSPVYEQIAGDAETFAHLSREDFEIVLPVSEVVSINIFDIDAYRAFADLREDT